jgi:prepilin-type N-terminal cleavage/methylation domain-containing protein
LSHFSVPRTVRSGGANDPTRRCPSGLTLLEILVVLVILGLALGLAAPSFLPSRHDPLDDAQAAVDAARRAAVRRAEAVVLTFESDGHWIVEDGIRGERLLEGTLGKLRQGEEGKSGSVTSSSSVVTSRLPDVAPLVLHVSPLGACTLDTVVPAESALTIDPLRCRLNTR